MFLVPVTDTRSLKSWWRFHGQLLLFLSVSNMLSSVVPLYPILYCLCCVSVCVHVHLLQESLYVSLKISVLHKECLQCFIVDGRYYGQKQMDLILHKFLDQV